MRTALTLLLATLVACGGPSEVAADAEPTAPAPAEQAEQAGADAVGAPAEPGATALAVDFTDAEGRIVCPVMGDVIASKEQAVGHTEHEGKTYWFCCDSCQHMFADYPERYAEGRFLAHLDAEHEGHFGRCNHLL